MANLRGSCATDSTEAHWMQEWEVSEYLVEVLQSYRLLFGQSKAGRELHSKHKPAKAGAPGHDGLLDQLCSEAQPLLGVLEDREAYNLASSFPFLSIRFQELSIYLETTKPRSWIELWKDRRDSAQWLTFWTVLLFGCCGLVLSFLGTVAQILQLWRSW